MGTIKALCISEKKGTLKTPVHKALFQTEWGMVGDAHAGRWHRQVSFLGLAEIEEFRKRGIDVKLGAFGENIVAEGFRFKDLPVGTLAEKHGFTNDKLFHRLFRERFHTTPLQLRKAAREKGS